jgi:hypothetical protein
LIIDAIVSLLIADIFIIIIIDIDIIIAYAIDYWYYYADIRWAILIWHYYAITPLAITLWLLFRLLIIIPLDIITLMPHFRFRHYFRHYADAIISHYAIIDITLMLITLITLTLRYWDYIILAIIDIIADYYIIDIHCHYYTDYVTISIISLIIDDISCHFH